MTLVPAGWVSGTQRGAWTGRTWGLRRTALNLVRVPVIDRSV